MYFYKWLLGIACVLGIVATIALTALHASAPVTTPVVGAAAARPAYVLVNTPTAVLITNSTRLVGCTTVDTDSELLGLGLALPAPPALR